MEDLIQDSSALKMTLLPKLQSLSNSASDLVNFGIQVCQHLSHKRRANVLQLAQLVIPHLADIRNSRETLHLKTLLSYVKQTIASTVGKGSRTEHSWDTVFDCIANVIGDTNAVVPVALENDSTSKSTYQITAINILCA